MKHHYAAKRKTESFLIEFRMHGYAKEYAKDVVYSVAKKFRVRGVTRKRVVPHISLYGPGTTNNIAEIISSIKRVGSRYTLVPFTISGFGYFNKIPKVIYFDINASQELTRLRWELSQELRTVSRGQSWDSSKGHAFHATIAFRDIDKKFNEIWSYLKSREEPNINQYLLRITLLVKGGRILCEYDLILQKLLDRREALSKYWWRQTINRLRVLEGLPPERPGSFIEKFKRLFGLSNINLLC